MQHCKTSHYRSQYSPPPVLILKKMNEFHALPSYILKFVLILWFRLRLVLPSSLYPTGYKTKTLRGFPVSIMRATCPVHFIFLDLTTRMIFC